MIDRCRPAIQADARRLLEQFAPVVRTIGEERVDHLAFDDDARVAAEPRAAQKIGDVAQTTRTRLRNTHSLPSASRRVMTTSL